MNPWENLTQLSNMTSWHRKAIKQHKEVRTPKYRQRVVPVIRNEKRNKAIEQEEKMEYEELQNELNNNGSSRKSGKDV